jgi:hypothetical protein
MLHYNISRVILSTTTLVSLRKFQVDFGQTMRQHSGDDVDVLVQSIIYNLNSAPGLQTLYVIESCVDLNDLENIHAAVRSAGVDAFQFGDERYNLSKYSYFVCK